MIYSIDNDNNSVGYSSTCCHSQINTQVKLQFSKETLDYHWKQISSKVDPSRKLHVAKTCRESFRAALPIDGSEKLLYQNHHRREASGFSRHIRSRCEQPFSSHWGASPILRPPPPSSMGLDVMGALGARRHSG